MMRRKGSSNIKGTVIIGYILVIGVMVFGLIALYNNLVDYSSKRTLHQDHTELLVVSNTLSLLYEIESEQNLLTSESTELYLQKYDSIVPVILENLDGLKEATMDTVRVVKLDSIKFLVELKKENLQVMAAVIDSLRQSPQILRQTESSYVPRELNREIIDYLEQRNLNPIGENQSDTSVVVGERKGFFNRMRDAISGRPDSTIVIESKSVVADREFALIVDTIINKVRYSERLDLRRQRHFQEVFLARQEEMIHTNRMLTERIDDLLKEIEQEEMMKSVQLLIDKEEALTRSEKTMRLTSLAGLLIALVFGLLFLIDINKSQRYRRQLEASNKRVSDLLAARERMMLAISHDIKAPMSSILGYLELLQGRKEEKYLTNMQQSGHHVLQLVSSLLDYHKLESGEWQMKQSNVNVFSLVEETTLSFKPMAVQKKLTYQIDNQVSPETVYYADPYMMRQIMGNLISNAIKYTSQGSVSVEARVEWKEGIAQFMFQVTDTGSGISLEDQEVIFQDFKQLDDSLGLQEQAEGSGLGLANTRRFVKEMKGDIRLESEKGNGSMFMVELPLEPAKEDAELIDHGITKAEEEAISSERLKMMEGLSVLVIDDDPVQLSMTAEMLNKAGVSVVTEVQPEEALRLLEERPFDLLFVDLQMPGIDGCMLVKEIRKSTSKAFHQLPIIALSARVDMTEAALEEAGFSGFLNKPFTFPQLCHTILKNIVNMEYAVDKEQVADSVDSPKGVQALVEFVKDDAEASMTILRSFMEETTRHIASLKEAFEENDSVAPGRIAHTVLPLARMTGDGFMVSCLERLEKNESLSVEEEQSLLISLENQVKEAGILVQEIEEKGDDHTTL